jgi:hypothetical protein
LVSQFPPDRKEYVLERFTTAREKLEAAGFGSRSLPGSAKEEEVLALGLDYFQLNIPCPFLEEESCSIHSHRPSSCREFLVTSSPVNCQDPGKNKVSAVPLATSLTEGLSKLSALLLGGDPQVIPMTLALDWALDNRELG